MEQLWGQDQQLARRIDKKISSLAAQLQDGKNPLLCLKRFLDDIFTIYTGTVENLHEFIEKLNDIHPTIKFTMNHTTPSAPTSENPATPHPVCAVEATPFHSWTPPVVSEMGR